MNTGYEQPHLWREDSREIDELRRAVDRARQAWQRMRLLHAIGSVEEQQYWEAYRAASDRLWERVRST